MKKGIYTVGENTRIAKNTYKMILNGDTKAISRPGQFVNISVEGLYLRRPFSICDYDDNSITIVYKAVGTGTLKMSEAKKGHKYDVLVGLGNGFDTEKSADRPLLIGGGAGIATLLCLAKKLCKKGCMVSAILGFSTKDEIFLKDEFEKFAKTYITTNDASYGIGGFVTAAMDIDYSYFYACGPEPMLKAVYDKSYTEGELSFEERMGCGFGACMGCSCKTKYKSKRICKDGHVLEKWEIVW